MIVILQEKSSQIFKGTNRGVYEFLRVLIFFPLPFWQNLGAQSSNIEQNWHSNAQGHRLREVRL